MSGMYNFISSIVKTVSSKIEIVVFKGFVLDSLVQSGCIDIAEYVFTSFFIWQMKSSLQSMKIMVTFEIQLGGRG